MSFRRESVRLAAASALGAAAAASAQEAPPGGAAGYRIPPQRGSGVAVTFSADAWLPRALDPSSDVAWAAGAVTQLSWAPFPFVQALARAGVQSLRLSSSDSILYVGGAAGLGYTTRLFERLSAGASVFAGLGRIPDYNGEDYGLYEIGARLEAGFRISAALSLGLSAGYERLANPNFGSLVDAISAGITFRISPSEGGRRGARLQFETVDTRPVFPVFRSWYDSEPLGTVTIRNGEDGAIENVRVYFEAPEYMGGPRLCTVVPRIERGAAAVVPLYAVFDERVLSLTENGSTSAAISAEYTFLGSRREAHRGFKLSLHHRNAMSWEDDRRAAAFVSPTDPGVLWFSRYANSIVRDRMRTDLPPNLQYALGLFEALRLYGLNYVIDPNSSYIELSENAASVDYLQYPSQTLLYRGGDCDDMSILYCSLLESSGIATAFITVPGHIYMAFDLGISEEEARQAFIDPGLLVFRQGRAWAPVEVTMVKDGFVKAWRVGAKQWVDNQRTGQAAFYPMKENWAVYPASGLQEASARFDLPDEAKTMAAFDAGVDRFVSRELEPVIAEYERKLAARRTPEVLNEYGTVMARAGLLDSAWERFVEAAKAGYPWAWNNLATVAFVRKDYALAYSYYEHAARLIPGDPVAALGLARSSYELARYTEAAALYEALQERTPDLAGRYGYLASAYGGPGRAWSMADRLAGSIWSRPGLDFRPPSVPATPAVAESLPASPSEEPAPVAPPSAMPEPAPVPETDAAPVETEAPQENAVIVDSVPPAAAPEPEPIPPPEPELRSESESPASPPAPTPESPAPIRPEPTSPPPPVPAPPVIVDQAPPDAEITAKAAEAPISAPPESAPKLEPQPPDPEPAPEILAAAPADADIAAKAAEAPLLAPPESAPEPAPVAPPEAKPEPASVPETAAAPVETEAPQEDVAVAGPSLPAAGVKSPDALVEAALEPEPQPPAGPPKEPEAPRETAAEPSPVDAPEPPLQPGPAVSIAPEASQPPTEEAPTRGAELPPEPPFFLDLSSPGIRPAGGTWIRKGFSASMTDPTAYYAKLILPRSDPAGASVYEFKARSSGSGWVGFGLHIYGRGALPGVGYGGGDSLLVWITRDPTAHGDSAPRLQVYRCTGPVDMLMVASVRLDGSAFDLRSYRVEYDPASGTLAVLVDGAPALRVEGLQAPGGSSFAALRALDKAEFSDVRIFPGGPETGSGGEKP